MKKTFYLFLTIATILLLNACTLEQICTQGDNSCDDGNLLTWSADGNWTEALDCKKSSQVCDVTKGCVECSNNDDCEKQFSDKPVCNEITKVCQPADALCSKGQMRCEGNIFQTCNDTQSGFDSTVCEALTPLCDPVKGCVACVNDTTRCVRDKSRGYSLSKCVESIWTFLNACPDGCNVEKTECAPCKSNTTMCVRNQVSTCTKGVWGAPVFCKLPQTCTDGKCSLTIKN